MKKYVFVCTGNTCRSPMAEGMFNALCRARGIDAYAISCGMSVGMPLPVSENAQVAAAEFSVDGAGRLVWQGGTGGVDISGHMSRPADEAALSGAEAIYCLTGAHARLLRGMFPEYADRIDVIAPRDVSDPFGGSLSDYEYTAELIAEAVNRLAETL